MTKSYTLQELSELAGGRVVGDGDLLISRINSLELAGDGDLSFVTNSKLAGQLAGTKASAVIVSPELEGVVANQIISNDPDMSVAIIHNNLLSRSFIATGIHKTAVTGSGCLIADMVSIGPRVCIGERVRIGRRVNIHSGVVIGNDVEIGDDCVIHANAVIAHGCLLGERVVLFHGAVIGSDGFGFATDKKTGVHISKPQVGIVRLDDGVQVGANSCVDRAAFGVTHVKSGVRIDNLVMVGHNVEIGENSILVGQCGVAGSTVLGRNVVLGAKSAIGGHLKIGDGVMVAGKSGVHNNQPAGAVVGGTPAFDIKRWGRSAAVYGKLPEMRREVRRLSREFEKIISTGVQKEKGVVDYMADEKKIDPPIDIKGILELLPHRYPFVMVDRVLEIEHGISIVGLKNVSMGEPFFQGHFPNEPVMPGVLILEGMAQAGGILAYLSEPKMIGEKLVYFAGLDNVRFRRVVRPGDQLVFRVEITRQRSRLTKMKGKAFVDNELAAEAELLATFS